jgi:protein-tyrosine phosphatase
VEQITSHIYLGDIADATNVAKIKSCGVTAVLCLLDKAQEAYWLQNVSYDGLERAVVPLQDGEPGQEVQLSIALNLLKRWLEEKKTVFIHCAAGVSRSATVVIGLLMETLHWNWDRAESYVRERRPIILPHPHLRRSMKIVTKEWPYDGSMDSTTAPIE